MKIISRAALTLVIATALVGPGFGASALAAPGNSDHVNVPAHALNPNHPHAKWEEETETPAQLATITVSPTVSTAQSTTALTTILTTEPTAEPPSQTEGTTEPTPTTTPTKTYEVRETDTPSVASDSDGHAESALQILARRGEEQQQKLPEVVERLAQRDTVTVVPKVSAEPVPTSTVETTTVAVAAETEVENTVAKRPATLAPAGDDNHQYRNVAEPRFEIATPSLWLMGTVLIAAVLFTMVNSFVGYRRGEL